MTGTVFNIQRFSVNDGPGIRTTVFLKGCPLRCKWCHNPESISPDPELVLKGERCIRCGECFDLCKNHAVQRVDGAYTTIRESCIACGDCVEGCNAEGREIAGKIMAAAEVMAEVLKDRIFYDHSRGGVSFSGGEPLLQHEFLCELLESSKTQGLHTVVDTTGMTTPAILSRVSANVDLFLYDLKSLDDKKHREFTGVSNEQILGNLKMLADLRKDVIVRVPVIPGFNDDPEDVKALGSFVATLGNVTEIHLLPYHTTGIEKLRRLGKENEMPPTQPPTADDLSIMFKELRTYVPTVTIGG